MVTTLAEERIRQLFKIASSRLDTEEDLAGRYVEIAQKIGMKTETALPKELRKKYCENCSSFLKPGHTCTVRLNSETRNSIYKCNNCGKEERYGY